MARTWVRLSLIVVIFALGCPSARAGQKEFQKLTVGYTPIAGAALPLFIAVEEKIFQKYGYEIFPVFMGGSPLINSAILAGRVSDRVHRRRRGDREPS
jgi:ABC-type nitrate/sulfonate/bicarbonate transport system substrate-binding protein